MNAGETAVLPTALRAPVAPQMPESRQPAALPAVHPAALPAAPPAALPAAPPAVQPAAPPAVLP
ncbi:hypothetical protein WS63_20050, partial [Burkholderia stagnalis]